MLGVWRCWWREGWRVERDCDRLATQQENFFTIKEPLINLTYVPKLHMRRMIPITLKPNSVEAQLHISSAILLFVFTGRSLTTQPFYLFIFFCLWWTEWCWCKGKYVIIVQYGNAKGAWGGIDDKQQRRSISLEAKAVVGNKRTTWLSPFQERDWRDNCSYLMTCHNKPVRNEYNMFCRI